MAMMKAVRIHSYGGAEVLVYEDAPRPQPQAGEVLIHVHAAGVNPVDWKMREGRIGSSQTLDRPLILGMDVAGVVEEVGPGVTTLQRGQAVYGMAATSRSGAYAEYAIADAEAIAPKPNSLNYVQAASVPVAAMTAWQALFDKGSLSTGQTVLIHAAAGGVGSFAVQLAKWKGAYVIGTTSATNSDFVRDLGADEVIDYQTVPFETVTHNVDVVLDAIGGDTRTRSWEVLKPNGTLVTLVRPAPEIPTSKPEAQGIAVVLQPKASLLSELSDLLDAGQVQTHIEQVLPLASVRQAHQLSQSGRTRGKVILQIADSSQT